MVLKSKHHLTNLRVFVLDDDDLLAWNLENELKALGAEVARSNTIAKALKVCPNFSPDVAICDLHLPDGNGLELVKKWHYEKPDMPVIMITAHGAIDSAVTALRLGAFDYIQKPFRIEDLIAATQRASEVSSLRQRLSKMEGHHSFNSKTDIIGQSDVIRDLKKTLEKVAKSKVNTVLITGPSGAGKELAARAIHEWSEHLLQPFVEINCASIPEALLESELFGFEKGAFTDARERKLGLFEIAKQGTIFLDEIGEMPYKLQAKLLRALEYHRFKRLGGTKDIAFSARIVAATNLSLIDEVAKGNFRKDLFYRLSVFPVEVPALVEHSEDIPEIADELLARVACELGIEKPSISQGAVRLLLEHDWPGNVRELKNVLLRASVMCEGNHIRSEDIHIDKVLEPDRQAATPSAPTASTVAEDPMHLPQSGVSLDQLEESLLKQALERSRCNQTQAAKLLGISRHTLRYRLQKHGLLEHEETQRI